MLHDDCRVGLTFVSFRLTLDVWALNPVWDISISKEVVKLPLVAEEEKDEIGKTDENVFQIIRCTRENDPIPHKKLLYCLLQNVVFVCQCDRNRQNN